MYGGKVFESVDIDFEVLTFDLGHRCCCPFDLGQGC